MISKMFNEKKKTEILKKDVEKLAKFAVENGINKQKMTKLAKKAFEEFKKKHKYNFKYKYHIIIIILSIIFALFYRNSQFFDLFHALIRIFIVQHIFPWLDLTALGDECLIFNQHLEQPKHEFICGKCPDVIDKIWKVDSEKLKKKLTEDKQPLMVIGASTQWKATNLFSLSFLADLYSSNDVLRASPPCNIYLNLQPGNHSDDNDHNNNAQHNKFKNVNDLLTHLKENLKPDDPAWLATWETCKAESHRVLRKFYQRPPRFIEGAHAHWIILSSNKQYQKFTSIETGTELAWYTHMKGCEGSKVVLEDKLCQCPNLYAILHPGDILYWSNDRWSFSVMIHPHGDVRAVCSGVLLGGFYQ